MIAIAMVMTLCALSQGVESCTCAPMHPQAEYCFAHIVLRGKFISQSNVTDDDPWIRYEVKTTKIFKAVGLSGDVESVYTTVSESTCGRLLPSINSDQDFLIYGQISDGRVNIGLCDSLTPWASLNSYQKRGIRHVYAKNCDCQIEGLYPLPVSTAAKRCKWPERHMERRSEYYTSTKTCADNGQGVCVWTSLRPNVHPPANKTTDQ